MNDEKLFNPYDASRPVDERNIVPIAVPDYVSQTRSWLEANPSRLQDALPALIRGTDIRTLVVNWIKQHPNAIPEIINEQYPDLREKLNSLGVLEQAGLDMAKAKFPPLGFLIDAIKEGKVEISPDISSQELLEGVKDASGETNAGLDGQGQDEQSGSEPGGSMSISKERWIEIIEAMVEMDDEGISPGKIADMIFDEYGVELTHQQIWNYIDRYRASRRGREVTEPKPDDSQAKALSKVLTEASRLKSENERLKAKEAEAMRKSEIESAVQEAVSKIQASSLSAQPERIGLIRKIGRALW